MKRAADWRWLLLFTSLAAGTADAQELAPEPRWSGTIHYDVQKIAPAPRRAFWHTVTTSVGRRFERGSVALQAVATKRFEISDQALVADMYRELWRGAYANVRVGVAPDAEVLSRIDLAGEIFHSIGNNELSARVRRQEFEMVEVNTLGVGVARYVGRWYLRPRSVIANVDDRWSPFFAFTARRYLGETTENLFDVSLGIGEEVLEVAAASAGGGALDVITSGSRFAAVRGQRFLGRRVGVSAGASYSDYAEIPDRWGVSLGLLTRW